MAATDRKRTPERMLEDLADKLLLHWTTICMRLSGSVAAVAAGVYGYRSIKVIAAGEPVAIPLTAFVALAAASFLLYRLSSKAASRLTQK